MLRVSNLLRSLSTASLRHRTAFKCSSTRAFSTQNNSNEDEDEDDLSLDLDWDDSNAHKDWTLDDKDDAASVDRRKVDEQVKQKVRVRRAQHSKRRFVDRVRVKTSGGHGGNGCASFFAESAVRKRPNGGHGGAGGDVVIEATGKMQNLGNATHHFKAGAGTNGMGA